jgi:hypothetical protein
MKLLWSYLFVVVFAWWFHVPTKHDRVGPFVDQDTCLKARDHKEEELMSEREYYDWLMNSKWPNRTSVCSWDGKKEVK